MERLKACYERYLDAAEKADKKQSAWGGAMGIGTSVKDHPCHDVFYEQMEEWSRAFLEENPTREQAEEAVAFLLQSAHKYRDHLTYWYMFAAHGFARPLIPLVSPEFAGQLRRWYDIYHPRQDRLPVQKEVYKLLKKQEKA